MPPTSQIKISDYRKKFEDFVSGNSVQQDMAPFDRMGGFRKTWVDFQNKIQSTTAYHFPKAFAEQSIETGKEIAKSVAKAPLRIGQTTWDIGQQAYGYEPGKGFNVPGLGKVEGYGRQFLEEAGDNADDFSNLNTLQAGIKAVSEGIIDASIIGGFLDKVIAKQALTMPKAVPASETATPSTKNIAQTRTAIGSSLSGAESVVGKGETGMTSSSELLQYAKGRLDDVAQKLGNLNPKLEQLYRATVKPDVTTVETTMKSILEPAKKILDYYERGGLTENLLSAITKNLPKAVQDFVREPKLGLSMKDVSSDLSSSLSKAKASGQSFDEWVKGQETLYHGSTDKGLKLKEDKALFLTDDFDSANTYAGGGYEWRGIKASGETTGFYPQKGKTLDLNKTENVKKIFQDIYGSPELKKTFDDIPETYRFLDREGDVRTLNPKHSASDFDDWLTMEYQSSPKIGRDGMKVRTGSYSFDEPSKEIRGKLYDAFYAYGQPTRQSVYNSWQKIIDSAKKKGYDYIKHTTESPDASITFPETVALNPKKSLLTRSQLKAEWDKVK